MSARRDLDIARQAAERAATLALQHQEAGFIVENKPDDSPVTVADRECEALIARLLEDSFPDDGILGEEGARKESRNGRRWIVDPIDGTRDFVRGNPLWSVLIGLEDHGEVIAGVAHLPMLGYTYWASRGEGAFRNNTRLQVSKVEDAGMAVLSLNGLNRIPDQEFLHGLIDWASRFWAVRSLGGTPDAVMVASGQMDAWIEPKVAPWDLAAPQVILEEAGAIFFDFHGNRTIYGGNAVACAPGLEKTLREFFLVPGPKHPD